MASSSLPQGEGRSEGDDKSGDREVRTDYAYNDSSS